MEQRRYRRAALSWPVTIKTGDDACQGRTLDISEGGIRIAVDRPLPRDSALSLAIEVEELPHVILTQGEIVRDVSSATGTEPLYSYGLRFTALSEQDRRCFSGNLAPEWRQEQKPLAQRPATLRTAAEHGTLPNGETLAAGGAPRKIGGRTEGNRLRHDPGGDTAASRHASRRGARPIVLLALAILTAGGIAWAWLHFRGLGGAADRPAATAPPATQPPASQPTIILQPLQVVPPQAPRVHGESPEHDTTPPSR